MTSIESKDALARFLDQHASDFLSWGFGSIVVSSHYDKQFRAMGGDTKLLISFFEDYGNIEEAVQGYLQQK